MELNWTEIKSKYPKAFSKMTSWINKNRFKGHKLGDTMLVECGEDTYFLKPLDESWFSKFIFDSLIDGENPKIEYFEMIEKRVKK